MEPLQVGSDDGRRRWRPISPQPDAVRSALELCLTVCPIAALRLLFWSPIRSSVFLFCLSIRLPRRAEEALAAVALAPEKSVPFDVDETVVSWMRQAGHQGNLEVVTAIARRSIIREYEEILENLGAKNVVVLSSTLRAAAARRAWLDAPRCASAARR